MKKCTAYKKNEQKDGEVGMMDREKVINGLRSIKTYLASQAFETEDSFAREGFVESQKDIDDAIAMLKEQETANLYKCPNCGTWVSAENVVRCKDCKHHGTMDCPMCEEGNCIFHTADNWFCADGERKPTQTNAKNNALDVR